MNVRFDRLLLRGLVFAGALSSLPVHADRPASYTTVNCMERQDEQIAKAVERVVSTLVSNRADTTINQNKLIALLQRWFGGNGGLSILAAGYFDVFMREKFWPAAQGGRVYPTIPLIFDCNDYSLSRIARVKDGINNTIFLSQGFFDPNIYIWTDPTGGFNINSCSGAIVHELAHLWGVSKTHLGDANEDWYNAALQASAAGDDAIYTNAYNYEFFYQEFSP
jgi:hypothetical protein